MPPRLPHFVDLSEEAVKTAKHDFYRAVGPAVLPADDLEVLTPTHFLGTVPLVLLAEPDLTKLNLNRSGRWQRITSYHKYSGAGGDVNN